MKNPKGGKSMETIRNYIENLFASLPKTAEVLKLKEELLQNMEEKYLEHKKEGRSENEAIGIVISEFGNIDELLEEMQITRSEQAGSEKEKMLTDQEADDYLQGSKAAGFRIAAGVMLCILSPLSLILGEYFFGERFEALFMIPMMFFIAFAVVLFITAAFQLRRYKHIHEGNFRVSAQKLAELQRRLERFIPKYAVLIGTSILLNFFGTISVIALEDTIYEDISPALLIFFISLSVGLIISLAFIGNPIHRLTKGQKPPLAIPEDKKIGKTVGAAAALIFPLSIAVYLPLSFLTGRWDLTWIIFPVVSLAFGGFCMGYLILKKNH